MQEVIALIYIECPHCHAIFSLPVGLEKLPERVRCGECSTVFIPEIDSQAAEKPPEIIEASSSTELSLDDFLTDAHNEAAENLPDDPVITEQQVEETLQDFNNYLTGDHYPVEPEAELPDLNLLSSSIPEIDDPLKNQQKPDVTEAISDTLTESLDDESADLISDRFDDSDEVIDRDETEDTASVTEYSDPDGLPEIRDELVTEPERPAETSGEKRSEQDAAHNAGYEKFRVYLESVNMAEDSQEDEQHSITSEISAFIDEIDEEPEDFYSADQTETEIERRLLDLDDDDAAFGAATEEADLSADHVPEQTDLVQQITEERETTSTSDAPSQTSLLPDDDGDASGDKPDLSPDKSDPFADDVASLELEVPEDFAALDNSDKAIKPAWPYIAGGILLIFLLALQYIYAHREEFATYPETRGIVTGLCRITGCEIEAQRDLGAIHLLNHAVYAHPAKENALIIKALIRNRAEFSQPYPVIELVLADLNDNRVALRRFGPGEYLTDKPAENALMPENANIPVQLQVLDPGQNAVAFEFEFL